MWKLWQRLGTKWSLLFNCLNYRAQMNRETINDILHFYVLYLCYRLTYINLILLKWLYKFCKNQHVADFSQTKTPYRSKKKWNHQEDTGEKGTLQIYFCRGWSYNFFFTSYFFLRKGGSMCKYPLNPIYSH